MCLLSVYDLKKVSVRLRRTPRGEFAIRDGTGAVRQIGNRLQPNAWHTVQLHLLRHGPNCAFEALLDGRSINPFTDYIIPCFRERIARIVIGDEVTRDYRLAFANTRAQMLPSTQYGDFGSTTRKTPCAPR